MSQDAIQAIRFPCGHGGINRSKNLYDFPLTDLTMSEGITTEFDTWAKEGGAQKINTTSMGAVSVRGVFDFWSADNPPVKEVVAVLADGRVVTLGPSGVVKTLKTGLGDAFPVFAEGWNGSTKALYIANGVSQIQEYTGGASAIDIPNPNVDWTIAKGFPSGLVPHRARLGAFGMFSRPHDVLLSMPVEHGNFKGTEVFRQEIDPGVGERIVAGLSWHKRLYFAKRPYGIFVLQDEDANLANWTIVPVTNAIGLPGPGCWVETDTDVLLLGTDGFFYSLAQVQTQGEESATPLLPMATASFIKEELNTDRLDLVQMVWYGHKRQVHIVAPGLGSPVNTRRIVADLHAGSLQFHYSRRDVAVSIALQRETATSPLKPIFGDNAGTVWKLDQAARNKGGVGYRGQFETAPQSFFPDGIRMGNLEYVEVIFQEQGNYDLTLEVHRDGKLSQTLAFSQQSVGSAVGSVSFDADVLGGTTIANRRRRAVGDATRCKLIGYNQAVDQHFSVQELNVQFTPGGDRRAA